MLYLSCLRAFPLNISRCDKAGFVSVRNHSGFKTSSWNSFPLLALLQTSLHSVPNSISLQLRRRTDEAQHELTRRNKNDCVSKNSNKNCIVVWKLILIPFSMKCKPSEFYYWTILHDRQSKLCTGRGVWMALRIQKWNITSIPKMKILRSIFWIFHSSTSMQGHKEKEKDIS